MTSWQYTPYTIPLFITAAITLFLTILVWRRRRTAGALPLALLTFAITIWAFGYALELASTDVATKILCAKVEYLGIVAPPLGWLIFASQFTGRQRWLTRRNLALLAIVPVVTVLMVWTNELHRLNWSNISVNTSAGFILLDYSYGPWFWVNIAFSYTYLLVGTIFLILAFIRTPQLYRGQILALLIAAFLPWVGNALYITGLNPFPYLDLTPFAFALAGISLAWGLLRYRFLNVAPIARGVAIENLRDALIVTDTLQRIVDLNPAAEKLIGASIDKVVGEPLEDTIAILAEQVARQQVGEDAHNEISFGEGEARRHYRLDISPLHDRRGQVTGQLITLSDITELRREEEISARRGRQLEAVAQVAREASTIHDLDQLLGQVTRLTAKQFGFYHVGIFLLDEPGKTAILRAANSEGGKRMLERGHRLQVGEVGIVGHVAETGKTRIALDVGDDAVFFQNPDLPETRSEMALPLTVREKVIGVLDMQSTQPQAFTREDIEILQILADQVAIAIENARLLIESQAVIRQLQTFSAGQAREAWQGRLHGQIQGYVYTPLGFKSLRDMKPLPKNTQSEGRHLMAVPIILRGQEIGRINLHREPSQPAWSKKEHALAIEIANQVALALENARLVSDAQQRAERERMLSQAAARMRETLDMDTILQTAARELQRGLNLKEAEVRLGLPDLRKALASKRKG